MFTIRSLRISFATFLILLVSARSFLAPLVSPNNNNMLLRPALKTMSRSWGLNSRLFSAVAGSEPAVLKAEVIPTNENDPELLKIRFVGAVAY